jgi:Tfp pilus assembly protein PilF
MMRTNTMKTSRVVLTLGVLSAAMILPACSSTSSRSKSGASGEIDPALAYARRQRAEAKEHYARATELAADGKDEEALAEYRRALELDDKLYAAWNNMGQLLMKQKNYADAVAAFQIAANIEPTDPRPNYNIGLAYQRVGWATDAYKSYQQSLSRDPNYIPAMRGLARSAEMLGTGDRALLEIIKQAQLREQDEQWRDYFRAQYQRVETLIANR